MLQRGEGFRHALQRAGLHAPELEILTPAPSSIGLGCQLFRQLMTHRPDVDAIFLVTTISPRAHYSKRGAWVFACR